MAGKECVGPVPAAPCLDKPPFSATMESMSRHCFFLPALLAAVCLLPSCAYMQTHKNVREAGRSYKGYQLQKPQQLHRAGNTWYIEAVPAEFRLSHEIVHDNVFRKTNEPEMKLTRESCEATAYHALSAGSAAVLLREDGYADAEVISRELMESPLPWLSTLPHASSTHSVKADVVGKESTAITYAPTPAEPPLGYQILSGIDLVLVDAPGTVIYNVAVPFMAPFVFFYEFLSED